MKKLIRVALALIVVLILFGFSPISAKANSDAIDLKLGDEGATSWNIANIAPGDSGTKTVTLHNAGYLDGYVIIWITDIKETDFAEDGAWLDDYVLFGFSSDRLNTNLNPPLRIDKFPKDATGQPNYLRINSIKAGETISLIWEWQFLYEAGNEAQGDSFSFTINYKLVGVPPPSAGEGYWEEPTCHRTYLSGKTVIAKSIDKQFQLIIEEGTVVLTRDDKPLSWIEMCKVKNSSEPPEDTNVISLFYNFKPDGATFDPPAILEYHYELDEIPENVDEEDLVIVLWDADAGEWIELECTVNTETQTITAKVKHFTVFAIFGYEAVTLPVVPTVPPKKTEPVPSSPKPPGPPEPPESTPSVSPGPSSPEPETPVPSVPQETSPLIEPVGETEEINWFLIVGIIVGLLVFSGIAYFIRRKREEKKHTN